MLFNSFVFFIFLPTVFLIYWFVFNKYLRWQNLFLLLASYFFYGWWSWKFLILLVLSTILDYLYGFGVASTNKWKSKIFLWLGIINNIGILGVFKYYDFFIRQVEHGFNLIGFHFQPTFLQIALPVGISFYTFHGLSYVFDIYRGIRKPVTNFIEYAVFVSFFPLLVAGPIERSNHLLPQVQSPRLFNYTQAVEGCRLILWGLFKKVVIADSLASIVDENFNNIQSHNAYTLILGAIGFSFQIYGDFSGYTDIALGTAKLFGFELLSNFKFPYFSRDIAEFWRRWHISLSSWFRDYLYIPLGGSKNGKMKAVRNIFIIFLVSGFWHGANWNYIVWGGIHACGFLPLLLLNKNRTYSSGIVAGDTILPNFKEFIQMLLTFSFVTFAWIFFRMKALGGAISYVKHIIVSTIEDPIQYLTIPKSLSIFYYIVPLIIMDWWFRKSERKLKVPIVPSYILWPIYILLFFMVANQLGLNQQFFFFQF